MYSTRIINAPGPRVDERRTLMRVIIVDISLIVFPRPRHPVISIKLYTLDIPPALPGLSCAIYIYISNDIMASH